ncbi:MAG: hypothetical protein A2Y40_07035 [Candidatus Margulisbacteria bacterium GWF2_35_9]|nr:MAG: hypothetical protein A2Y40_07035 [Candidatus Margulisbacteria bacterium GWF2_35_9]
MNIKTIRFGEIEVDNDKILSFVVGPLGFENNLRWVIVDNGLLGWLQSIDDPELAFVVANPFEFYENYEFSINPEEMKLLEVTTDKEVSVLSIVSIPPKVENMTINLLAPIVINMKGHKAKQVILNSNKYTVRHFVYNDLLKIKESKRDVAAQC